MYSLMCKCLFSRYYIISAPFFLSPRTPLNEMFKILQTLHNLFPSFQSICTRTRVSVHSPDITSPLPLNSNLRICTPSWENIYLQDINLPLQSICSPC